MSDDPEDPKIVSASFAEPYMLLVRDDSSLMILKADESGELDEIACRESLQSTKWLSGSLFDDSDDTFRLELNEDDEESSSVLMFLLSVTGGLKVKGSATFRNRQMSNEIEDFPNVKARSTCVYGGGTELPPSFPLAGFYRSKVKCS